MTGSPGARERRRGVPSTPGRLRRLCHTVLQRLHTPRHQRRHRRAVEAMLDELLAAARDDLVRRRVLRHALRDACKTLGSSWRDALLGPLAPAKLSFRRALESVLSDVGFALRFHRRMPVYALVTVVTLALAIGANTAIFTVAEAALFRTLPYEAPDRFFEVRDWNRGLVRMGERDGGTVWVPTELITTVPGIDASATYIPDGGANLEGDAGARRLDLVQTTDDFFRVLGVRMLLGSGFTALEGRTDVVVISHAVWTQDFGADPDIIGRTIRLSSLPFAVVGVAPPEVDFPGGIDLWVPQPLRWEFYSEAAGSALIARLERGADRRAVEDMLDARTASLRAEVEVPEGRPDPVPTLMPLRHVLTESVRVPLVVLGVAAVLVFLLGCLNLAGLAVSHFLRRSAELQMRIALGAGRLRVYRQLAVEALVLCVVGAAFGLVVAVAGVEALVASLPGEVSGLESAGLGATSLALGVGLAVIAGLFLNALPALQVVGPVGLEAAGRAATETRGQARLRAGLTIAQVAVALVLLSAAGLLGRSLVGLATTPIGIDVDSVLTFQAHVAHEQQADGEDDEAYNERVLAARNRYVDRVEEGLAGIGDVVAVGVVSQLPMSRGLTSSWGFRLEGSSEEDRVSLRTFEATPGYFDAIGIPLVYGRSFSSTAAGEPEMILSRRGAEALFGTASAVGRTALMSSGRDWKPMTVVGVVEDILYGGPDSQPHESVYTPLSRSRDSQIGFALRVRGEPARLAAVVQRVLADVDPTVPAYNLQTSRQAVSRELAARSALATVSGLVAITALLLAGIGIYGLIAESVARRRREIGIRMVLGARTGAVAAMVTGRGLAMAVVGAVVAAPVLLSGGRLLDDVLYGVSPRDPVTLVAAPVVLLLVAALAAWVPARRAAGIDPVEVLSSE